MTKGRTIAGAVKLPAIVALKRDDRRIKMGSDKSMEEAEARRKDDRESPQIMRVIMYNLV